MNASMPASSESFQQLTHFGGLDWGQYHHYLVVEDSAGQIVLSLRFADDAQGWLQMRERIAALGGKLGVAIETSCGPTVERLLSDGVVVYPLNPKAAQSYRDRKSPAGVKDDERDAWSMADALRADGHAWRPLLRQDPLTAELAMLCRDEIALIEQRTALVLQLRAALHEYYPAALQAFEDWTSPAAWRLVIQFPDPQRLFSAGRRKWEKFLHAHKLYRPETASRRLEIFAAAMSQTNPNQAVTRAKSLLAVSLAHQLLLLESQLKEYRQRIQTLFNDHPDSGFFGSLPGAGPKLAPRLLGELGSNRQVFQSVQSLQCYAGTAPVTRQSGRTRYVVARRACNKVLRATVHLWSDQSRHTCAWAQAYYQKKKEQGMGHAAALRCLGQRWLKILWTMWQRGCAYDEALHTRNQVNSGSWVVQLIPPLPTS